MEMLRVENGELMSGADRFALRGFGLGGWLLPEGYMWLFYTKCDRPRRIEALIEELCGAEYAAGFWRRYYDSYITRRDIEYISAHGFNSVRLPLNARHLGEPDYLRHVDECIGWCKSYGVYVVLDMHAAPGGQTGQNIDDSERDLPELFMDRSHQDELVRLWRDLAARYAGESAVAGYDLLNEPLIKKDAQYNAQLIPLYLRLTEAIREVDPGHIVIWEGAHWATDFSVFDGLRPEQLPENLMLQFHKYWSGADRESLDAFVDTARRLNVPLYCGESGENNLEWYTTLFPMLDSHSISWSFWSYKKMRTENSVSVFPEPRRWGELIEYLDGGRRPDDAYGIFDDFLECLTRPVFHDEVIYALNRTAPVLIPCEAFDSVTSRHERTPGAVFRMRERAQLIYADGHTGEPDCRRYGGEPRPESERMLLRLRTGESATYALNGTGAVRVKVNCRGDGVLTLNGAELDVPAAGEHKIEAAPGGMITIACVEGDIYLENLEVIPCG